MPWSIDENLKQEHSLPPFGERRTLNEHVGLAKTIRAGHSFIIIPPSPLDLLITAMTMFDRLFLPHPSPTVQLLTIHSLLLVSIILLAQRNLEVSEASAPR